jgi:hypothetical protein
MHGFIHWVERFRVSCNRQAQEFVTSMFVPTTTAGSPTISSPPLMRFMHHASAARRQQSPNAVKVVEKTGGSALHIAVRQDVPFVRYFPHQDCADCALSQRAYLWDGP